MVQLPQQLLLVLLQTFSTSSRKKERCHIAEDARWQRILDKKGQTDEKYIAIPHNMLTSYITLIDPILLSSFKLANKLRSKHLLLLPVMNAVQLAQGSCSGQT